jgi:hypothetical protein
MDINQFKNIIQFYWLNTNYLGYIFENPTYTLEIYFHYIGGIPSVHKTLNERYQEGFDRYVSRYELTNIVEKEIIECIINFTVDVNCSYLKPILKTFRPAFEENIGDISIVKNTELCYSDAVLDFINDNERLFKLLTLM